MILPAGTCATQPFSIPYDTIFRLCLWLPFAVVVMIALASWTPGKSYKHWRVVVARLLVRLLYATNVRERARSEDMAQGKCCDVVGRLNPALYLQSQCLTEGWRAKREMHVPVEQNSRITPFTCAVINTNSRNYP